MTENRSTSLRGMMEMPMVRRVFDTVDGAMGFNLRRQLDYKLYRTFNQIRIPLLHKLTRREP